MVLAQREELEEEAPRGSPGGSGKGSGDRNLPGNGESVSDRTDSKPSGQEKGTRPSHPMSADQLWRGDPQGHVRAGPGENSVRALSADQPRVLAPGGI
jgi:hypothetical protein